MAEDKELYKKLSKALDIHQVKTNRKSVGEWAVGGVDMGDTCYIVFMEFEGEALKVFPHIDSFF